MESGEAGEDNGDSTCSALLRWLLAVWLACAGANAAAALSVVLFMTGSAAVEVLSDAAVALLLVALRVLVSVLVWMSTCVLLAEAKVEAGTDGTGGAG